MTDRLPHQLLVLFAPRPPLRYVPALDHPPGDRHTSKVSGVAQYLDALKEYKESDTSVPTESWLQRRERVQAEKAEKHKAFMEEAIAKYDPSTDSNIRGDPFKTLFVSRLSYDVKQEDLEREFDRFGPIERVRLVYPAGEEDDSEDGERKKKKKKSRGYAFIVFQRERDMKAAFKEADGIRIKDRRIMVDVERGRTVKEWKPTRLGGGLGGRGYTKPNSGGPGLPAGPRSVGMSGGSFRGGMAGGGGGRRGFGGGRGGIDSVPAGPRGPRGGFERERRDWGGSSYRNGGGGGGEFGSGSNREPIRQRERGGAGDDHRGGDRYRDPDRERGDRDRGDRDRGDRDRDRGDRERGERSDRGDRGDRDRGDRDRGDRYRDRGREYHDRDHPREYRDRDRDRDRRDEDYGRKRRHDDEDHGRSMRRRY